MQIQEKTGAIKSLNLEQKTLDESFKTFFKCNFGKILSSKYHWKMYLAYPNFHTFILFQSF
jgi:hypothetical protein